MPRIIPALLLLLMSASASGATTPDKDKENLYEVEVVVFATRLPGLVGDELWTSDTVNLNLAGLNDAVIPPAAKPSEMLLTDAAADLGRNSRFRVLAHKDWIQTAEAKSDSKAVRIQGGAAEELDGTLRFYMSRYLHLDINMIYQEAAGGGILGAAADRGEKVSFRITEQRRIKSQETHYFDHPKFGLLVRVKPLQTDKPR